MSFQIVPAGPADLEKLMAWRMEVLHVVFSIPSDVRLQELEQANRAYYQKHLADGTHLAVFLEQEGKTAGCGGICFYQEMPSPDNPSGWCGYLMNIYTREEYRHQGGAKKTVEYLISQARKRHVSKIYLETSEAGRDLYESLGFTDMKDYLKLKS